MEICPYCGTRNPIAAGTADQPSPRCHECGGVLDDLSMMATQIAMGPWFFRMAGKPFGPGCDISILRKLLAAGRIKPGSAVRGPASHQLWRRVKNVPGIAHLAGACHACGESVKPDSKFCQGCGTRFDTPQERNQWGLPAAPVSELIAEARKVDGDLCCICGHDKSPGDECAECETIFSPPDEATPITLGGWFIHGKAYAFKPGMSYDQLKKGIAAGSITGRTVVRGPTTEQFWKLAKNTAGVAHLTGFCHACGEKVEASAESCPACKASFGVPADADWVGLRYPTPQAAAAAQEHLDEELAKIAATLPPAPPPKRKVRPPAQENIDEEGAETVDEYAEDVEIYDEMPSGYGEGDDPHGYESYEEPAGDDEHAHEPALVGAAAGDAGGFDLSAVAAPSVAGKERRIAQQYQSSQKTLMTWLILTPLILLGAFLAINALSNGGDDGAGTAAGNGKDAAVKDAGPEVLPAVELVKLKQDTATRLNQYKQMERKGKFAALLQEADTAMARGNELLESKQFLEADAAFRKVETPLREVDRLLQQRAQATETRGRAQAAMNEAKQLGATDHAGEQWKEAESSFALGAKLLDEENFDQAIVAWNNATEQYGKASRLVQVMLAAADVRTKIEAEAMGTFTREELEREQVPAWKAFKAKLKAGDDAVAQKKYEEAMQFFDQARQMVDSVNVGMRLEVGRSYWAYQAGRLTMRILKDKAAGNHPDEETLAQLKRIYENLQINRDFFNRIPLDKKCSYRELGEVLILECAKEIEGAFENGAAIRSSFGQGMHLYIVEKALRADLGKLAPGTRQDIELYVKKVIPDAAKTSGYAPEFLAAVKDFDETLATEVNIPVKSREKWGALVEKLDNFETAIKIVGVK